MDFLRLPGTLRRAILSAANADRLPCRSSSTTAYFSPTASQHEPPPTPKPSTFLSLSSSALNDYTVSLVPTQTELRTANAYFTRHAPHILYTTAHFRNFPASPFPEVAFLGRSNVGKSSLLNALLGRPKDKPAHVSKRPGRTKTMNGFGIGADMIGAKAFKTEDNRIQSAWKRFGRGGIVVVDMPGYGGGSRADWGTEALKYLEKRKQLRRTFVLVDSEHGLKKSDIELLVHMRKSGIAHQVVLSKVDKLLCPRSAVPSVQRVHNGLLKIQNICTTVRQTLNEHAGDSRNGVGDILACSSEKNLDSSGQHRKIGIDELRFAVLSACGMEKGMQNTSLTDSFNILEEQESVQVPDAFDLHGLDLSRT